MSRPELRLNALELIDQGEGNEYRFDVYGTDFSLGKPPSIMSAVRAFLQASSEEESRTLTFVVVVTGADLLSLADGEAALHRECVNAVTLTYTPADGYGPATVFDVWGADFEPFYNDLLELKLKQRAYRLTLTCEPFGRSESEVIDPALTVGGTPTTVTISDGTSATGWSSPDGTVTSTGGYILIPSGVLDSVDAYGGGIRKWNNFADASVALSAVDFTATPYVSFDVAPDHAWETLPYPPRVYVDGVELTHIASSWVGGSQRHTFVCNDASASSLRIRTLVVSTSTSPTQPDAAMRIDNVSRSNQPPTPSATVKQSLRTINVQGSARTKGSLSVSATTGLGDVLLYTCPALATGYTPDLRKWLSSGDPTTTDAAAVYGSTVTMAGGWWAFTAPAASFPRGGYVLKARIKNVGASSGTAKMSWTAATKVGSTTLAQQAGTGPQVTVAAGAFQIVTLGFVTLPPTDLPDGSSGSIFLQLKKLSGTATVVLDEFWAYYAGDDASLTQVACGAGTPAIGTVHNRLWLDAGENGDPQRVLVGTQADRSDAFNAGELAAAWDEHRYPAGPLLAHVVTTGPSELAAVEYRHFPRWATHAGSVTGSVA